MNYLFGFFKGSQSDETATIGDEGDCVVSAINIYPIKSCRGISVQSAKIGKYGFVDDRKWLVVDKERSHMITARVATKLLLVQPRYSDDKKTLIVDYPGTSSLQIPLDGDSVSKGPFRNITMWNSLEVPAIEESPEASKWFSDVVGKEAILVRLSEEHNRPIPAEHFKDGREQLISFVDDGPFLLCSEESLGDLNSRLEKKLPWTRFRPNIIVRAKEGKPWMEDSWKKITIGKNEFNVFDECARCKMTTLDTEKGAADGAEPLNTLATFRQGRIKGGKEVTFGVLLSHDSVHGEISVGQPVVIVETKNTQ